MSTVVLVLHLFIAASLVGVVLLQRSEGGGLGMGNSSSSFMTGRGSANFLTRVTAGLAAAFFVTSISLTLLAKQNTAPISPLDRPTPSSGAPATKPGGVLDGLQKGTPVLPPVPKNQ